MKPKAACAEAGQGPELCALVEPNSPDLDRDGEPEIVPESALETTPERANT